jgi:hypothetical protein
MHCNCIWVPLINYRGFHVCLFNRDAPLEKHEIHAFGEVRHAPHITTFFVFVFAVFFFFLGLFNLI